MFRYPIGILPADIDHMGHVNNSVYLKWVQDAVVDYWRSIAPPEAVAKHLWVALKHEISYLKPTFLQDTVVAEGRGGLALGGAQGGEEVAGLLDLAHALAAAARHRLDQDREPDRLGFAREALGVLVFS